MEKNIFETEYLQGKRETTVKDLEAYNIIVEERYRADGVDEKTLGHYKIHNKQVLDFVREISREEKFSESESEIAEIGAIFHDITKGTDFENHGKDGGESAREIIHAAGKSSQLAESVRQAIDRHMGNTGYVGRKARERFGADFRYGEPTTKAEQCLYDADMLTMLTPEGVKKLLRLRQITPEDLEEDKKISKEKNISVEDAALLSIADSIQNTLSSIKFNSSRKIAQKLLEKILQEYPQFSMN